MGENYKDNYKNVSLIALKGARDSGKTTTLKNLIDELIKDGWKEGVGEHQFDKFIIPDNSKGVEDYLTVLTKAETTVVICTAGDIVQNYYIIYIFLKIIIFIYLNLLKEKNRNIILVCPCRKENSNTYKCLFKQTEFKNRFKVEKSKNSYDDDKKVKELIKAINQKLYEQKLG